MPITHAQKPLLLPNPIPFPHQPDTYLPQPTPTPSLVPKPQLPPSFLRNLLDAISTIPHPILLLLIAVLGILVLYRAAALVKGSARGRRERRELRKVLGEKMEENGMAAENDGEDDEDEEY